MSNTIKIEVKDQNPLAALQDFFRSLLNLKDIDALFIPQHLPMKNVVMPTLITDSDHLQKIDPLAPAFPLNGAKLVARLTHKPIGKKVAVVLRPCEIRAFIELVKLKQGRPEELIIIGIDCLGAYNNKDYNSFVDKNGPESTRLFYQNILDGKKGVIDGIDLAPACKACEHPVPETADIIIALLGIDINKQLFVITKSPKGDDIIDKLNFDKADEPATRLEAVTSLKADRIAWRDKMFAQTDKDTNDIEKLTKYLAGCVNCYNCRVACPVCYCKECVFVTDVFNHEPFQYLKWADRKGILKMPTDTIFFHITRMAHISLACVGCGQCSNACPNNIPLTELFRSAAFRAQKAFDYEAGRDFAESPPLAVFHEDEFSEVTSGK